MIPNNEHVRGLMSLAGLILVILGLASAFGASSSQQTLAFLIMGVFGIQFAHSMEIDAQVKELKKQLDELGYTAEDS